MEQAELRSELHKRITQVHLENKEEDCPLKQCFYVCVCVLALVSDIAIFVLKRDVKLQLTGRVLAQYDVVYNNDLKPVVEHGVFVSCHLSVQEIYWPLS